jgi:hypothetical protein
VARKQMSLVSQKLFGTFPSFLKLKTNRNLFETVAALPKYGVGLRVTENAWRTLPNCYYRITDIQMNSDLKSGTVTGHKVWFGRETKKPIEIEQAELRKWGLYHSKEENEGLLKKLQA